MDYFERKQRVLHAENIALVDIAARFGTPTYVYSAATVTRHVRVLQEGLRDLDHVLCYAVKANGNLAILQLLNQLGVHFDAVSVGELARVLKAGGQGNTTILSGVGKRDDEIRAALRAGVMYICAESAEEIDAIARIAQEMGLRAPVSVRVNPDVDAQTHPYISTGLKQNKFGVPMQDALALYQRAQQYTSLAMVGVTCHIGSQITDLQPFLDAAQRMVVLVKQLKDVGMPLRHVGLGGGLGIPYGHETPPSPKAYGEALTGILRPLQLQVVFEPGRVIIGNAGILLTRVVRQKAGADRHFVLVDAGMNDLLRPALYNAYHDIVRVVDTNETEVAPVDVVGPVCESADTFAKGRTLPPLHAGDLVALRSAGAYGFVMSSTYNGRPQPAEVLVDGDSATLVRARSSLADLWHGEAGLHGEPFDAAVPQACRALPV